MTLSAKLPEKVENLCREHRQGSLEITPCSKPAQWRQPPAREPSRFPSQVAIVWEGGETATGTRKAGEPPGEDEE